MCHCAPRLLDLAVWMQPHFFFMETGVLQWSRRGAKKAPKAFTGWWFRSWYRPLTVLIVSLLPSLASLPWLRFTSAAPMSDIQQLRRCRRSAAADGGRRRRSPLTLPAIPPSVWQVTLITILLPFFNYIIGLVGAIGAALCHCAIVLGRAHQRATGGRSAAASEQMQRLSPSSPLCRAPAISMTIP